MITGWSQVKIQDYSQLPFNVFLPQPSVGSNMMSSHAPTSKPSQSEMLIQEGQLPPNQSPFAYQGTADPRLMSATSFMPGTTKGNRYMNMLKKNAKHAQNTASAAAKTKPKRIVQTAMTEEQKQRRQKMRKYVPQGGTNGVPQGYIRVLEQTGGEAIGENNRNEIDEYLGIGSSNNEGIDIKSMEGTHSNIENGAIKRGNSSIKKLQDEQRDIEAKLKFIDGLINQQQNPQPKYFGGGILKKHTTEDFVVNLEQYQRAMEDIRKTMENLHGNKAGKNQQRNLFNNQSTGPHSNQPAQTGTTLKSLQDGFSPNSQNITIKKYNNQYEEYIHQQNNAGSIIAGKMVQQTSSNGNQRQVLSVIPTVSGGQEEVDKVSMSSHYTNDARLYDPTLLRQSIDSTQLRHSIKSASFVSGRKLDFGNGGNNQQEAHQGKVESPQRDVATPNYQATGGPHKRPQLKALSNQQVPTVMITNSSKGNDLRASTSNSQPINNQFASDAGISERHLVGAHPPVIEDTREETTIDRDDSDIMGERESFERYHQQPPQNLITNHDNQVTMTKVEIVFDDERNVKPNYKGKMYRARTQVTNPSFQPKTATNKQSKFKPDQKSRHSLEHQRQQPLQPINDILGKLPDFHTQSLTKDAVDFRTSPIKVPREVLALQNQNSLETETSIGRVASQKTISMLPTQPLNNSQLSASEHPLLQPGSPSYLKHPPSPSRTQTFLTPLALQIHQQIDDQRLTEMGKKAIQLNRQSQSRLEVLDTNVIYQQDGDLSKGVLYFKNLDSLKSFILNKKRPIYSRKGNKVFQTEDALTGFKLSRNGSEFEDEKSRSLKADIQKKRQYLHNTLTNLMPQIQLRLIEKKKNQQRTNFQQAIDFVSKKVMGKTHSGVLPHPSTTTLQTALTGTGPLINGKTTSAITMTGQQKREMTWAPISNIQQYPFDDMMNPDGIIDLRILGAITPSGVIVPGTNGSQHLITFSRYQPEGSGNSVIHVRSESNPGLSLNGVRDFSRMSKRLQTFYGLQQLAGDPLGSQKQSVIKGAPQPSNKKLNNHESEHSLEGNSDSNDETNSSHPQTGQRQVVFFKTTTSNLRHPENGGTFMMQYPTLRPRLLEEPSSATNAKSHTVGMHQQYMKSVERIAAQQSRHQMLRGNGFSTAQNPPGGMRLKQENSLLRMSRGIERNKIKHGTASISAANPNTMGARGDDNMSRTMGNFVQNQPEGETATPQQNLRKHVIFSSYEGKASSVSEKQVISTKAGATHPNLNLEEFRAEKRLNLPTTTASAGFKIPPIHPLKSNGQNMSSVSSRPQSRNGENKPSNVMVGGSFFGSQNANNLNKDYTSLPANLSTQGGGDSSLMPPVCSSLHTLQQNTTVLRPPRPSNESKKQPRNLGEQTSPKNNTIPMRGLALIAQSPSGPTQGSSSNAAYNLDISHNIKMVPAVGIVQFTQSKMDQTIAQNKFSVQK